MARKKHRFSAASRDMLRAVRKSQSRFWAIFGIVALGAGFFCGLLSCGPSMRDTVDRYYDESNMMDIQILSTLGLTDADTKEVAGIEGVTGVMPAYQTDAAVVLNEEEMTTRFHSLPEDFSAENQDYINHPVLLEGRWPKNDSECVLGLQQTGDTGKSLIGSTIHFESENLNRKECKVVGIIKSSYYVSFTIGSSALGGGQVDMYAYVPKSAFDMEAYTEMFVTVADTKKLDSFGTRYEAVVDEVQERLEKLGKDRTVIRTGEVKGDALKELEDSQKELDEQKQAAEKELAKAEKKLTESEKKLNDGRKQLKKGQQALETGKEELEASQEMLDRGRDLLIDAKWDLRWGQMEYNNQLSAFNAQKERAEEKFAAARKELAEKRRQLQDGKKKLALAQKALKDTEAWIDDLERQIENLENKGLIHEASGLRKTLEQARELWKQGNEEVQAQEQVVKEGEAALAAGEKELDRQEKSANAELEKGEKQLHAASEKLSAGQAEIDAKQRELNAGQAEIDLGLLKIKENEKKLNDSKKEIEDGEKALQEGQSEYKLKKAEADKKLQDAQGQIDEARQKIEDIESAQWYVLDRGANMGYVSFKNDAKRMDALSTVFPVIFFLVAALVALTTMTRMVEEERVTIGTYKALGYTTGRIAFKYLFYAGSATLLGCVIGPLIGFQALPQVVWQAYRIVYSGPDMYPVYHISYALIATGVLLLCTMGSTFSVCRSALRETPASLMLPKAPKAGKRILLEHITPIWKHLSFTHKVTARNLFLYKKRLIMTMAGIAGCTALLVTGFGVRDSISDILDVQYGELYRYNTTVALLDDCDPEELRDPMNEVLKEPAFAVQHAGEVTDSGGNSVNVTVQSPQSSAELVNLIDFRTRSGHRRVPFDDDSVVISEKLSAVTGAGIGDSLRVKIGDRWRDVTVTGITEQYVYHYIYMGPAVYEKTFGRPQWNQVLGIYTGDDRDAFSEQLLENKNISSVSFSSEIQETFGTMLKSMNYVVLILIFCAGMLAFIVLYNLTNININERQREIATIKVLGFYDREVSMYVYRETIMLTLMGCFIGLLLGMVLHIFVINTVEVDMVMFGRIIKPLSFLWSFLLTMLFSVLVNLVMERKLRKISMADSLKSVE